MPAAACSLCSPDPTTVLTNKQVEHGQMQKNWIRSVCILDVRRDPCHGHGQLVMHSLAGDDRDQTTVLLHVMGGPQCQQPLLVADNSFIPPNPHHHIYRMHECPRHLGSWNSSSTSSCRGVVLTPLQAQATPTHACMHAPTWLAGVFDAVLCPSVPVGVFDELLAKCARHCVRPMFNPEIWQTDVHLHTRFRCFGFF